MRLLISIFSLFFVMNTAAAQDLRPYEAEAGQVLQRLRGEMMAEMQKAMEIGPKAAIGVCRHLAPEIEERIEKETGWELRRTGIRVRSPANAATADELGILRGYDVRALAGQGPEFLRTLRLTEQDGKKMVHFMQAIPTFDVCLSCHGENIAPAVMDEIKALYPQDDAVGYKIGDIRGAFSLYKEFDPSRQGEQKPTEWDRIAALKLPDAVTLNDAGKSGNAVQGRDVFKRHCIGCHSPSDLAQQLFQPDGTAQDANLCVKLETHGATDPANDCNIVAFLKALQLAEKN